VYGAKSFQLLTKRSTGIKGTNPTIVKIMGGAVTKPKTALREKSPPTPKKLRQENL
jgi:hypothetical protein